MTFIDTPFASADAYVDFLSAQDVPVLRRTVQEFGTLAASDSTGGRQVAAVVIADPLMTLKVLTTLQARRGPKQNHDITTIERAIMMMGVTPFFAIFSGLGTVEERLAAHPQALVGVLGTIGRARRAAHLARDWAILRHDLDVDEITVAALLKDAVEIMCWTFAPAMTQRVFEMQRANRWLRRADAQRAVFGVTAHEIQAGLVRAWKLPELLVTLMDADQAGNPRVRNVLLANAVARHLQSGWDNDALPDDIAELSELVHLSPELLLARLGAPAEELHRFFPPAT
ncbi:HDOD domain-containing protein [Aromatoleum toluvorans]|uniref:HDOD domain-containing protein n=1 Tax=Aromatoleum toluvorans TaxID=92002 RepID=A0ABX1Q1D3_9RHOO|nr:HDOD domain-containing protein [Aromatoleum toluvorans]NMG45235.1 HDOD domain-containing protein [Aromatoleum toluvorans]